MAEFVSFVIIGKQVFQPCDNSSVTPELMKSYERELKQLERVFLGRLGSRGGSSSSASLSHGNETGDRIEDFSPSWGRYETGINTEYDQHDDDQEDSESKKLSSLYPSNYSSGYDRENVIFVKDKDDKVSFRSKIKRAISAPSLMNINEGYTQKKSKMDFSIADYHQGRSIIG
jgi:hypothetical protein